MDTILLFGYDRHLLESRSWLLERAGYIVLTVTSLSQMKSIDQRIDLLILCHSLCPEDFSGATALLHLRWPSAKELRMASHLCDDIAEDDNVHSTLDGPARLLRTVDELLHTSPSRVVVFRRPKDADGPLLSLE